MTVACTYSRIGEEDGNPTGLLQDEFNNTTPFKVHVYPGLNFYQQIVNPSQTSPTTRTLERDVGRLDGAPPADTGPDDAADQTPG